MHTACSILSINLEGKDKTTGEMTRSVLHVIDLAGSERIAHSNVVRGRHWIAVAVASPLFQRHSQDSSATHYRVSLAWCWCPDPDNFRLATV
jgi:hypothetical protein